MSDLSSESSNEGYIDITTKDIKSSSSSDGGVASILDENMKKFSEKKDSVEKKSKSESSSTTIEESKVETIESTKKIALPKKLPKKVISKKKPTKKAPVPEDKILKSSIAEKSSSSSSSREKEVTFSKPSRVKGKRPKMTKSISSKSIPKGKRLGEIQNLGINIPKNGSKIKKSTSKKTAASEVIIVNPPKTRIVNGMCLTHIIEKAIEKRAALWISKINAAKPFNKKKFEETFEKELPCKGKSNSELTKAVKMVLLDFFDPKTFWSILSTNYNEKYGLKEAISTITFEANFKRKQHLVKEAEISFLYAVLKFAPGAIKIVIDGVEIKENDLDILFTEKSNNEYEGMFDGKRYFFNELSFISGYKYIKREFKKSENIFGLKKSNGEYFQYIVEE